MTKSKNPKKGQDIQLRMDTAELLHVSARPLDEGETLEDLQVPDGSMTVGSVNARTGESNFTRVNLDEEGREPTDLMYVAGLDGGLVVLVRRLTIIEDYVIDLGMLFHLHAVPLTDFSDAGLRDSLDDMAKTQLYSLAYPWLASRADAVYSQMGRIRGIGHMPDTARTEIEQIETLYRSDAVEALRAERDSVLE